MPFTASGTDCGKQAGTINQWPAGSKRFHFTGGACQDPLETWHSSAAVVDSMRKQPSWRGGRVAEGARLESVFRGNSNVSSNLTLSATLESLTYTKAPSSGQSRAIRLFLRTQPLSKTPDGVRSEPPRDLPYREFEKRKKGWKRCACLILALGALARKFGRRSTRSRKLKRLWNLCGPWSAPPTHHRFRRTFARITLREGSEHSGRNTNLCAPETCTPES